MKNIPRFFIQDIQVNKQKFYLDKLDDIKKIRQVLRLDAGGQIKLISEINVYTGQIDSLSKTRLEGVILESELIPASNKPKIILAQALPKGSKLDEIVNNCTQIGVSEFVFFESDYSIVKLKDFREKKLERLNKIALSASEQSERLSLPVINPPVKFENILNIEADEKLLLHSREVEGSVSLESFRVEPSFRLGRNLTEKREKNTNEPRGMTEESNISILNTQYPILVEVAPLSGALTTLCVVGPEGGFSDEEVKMAKEKGFKIVFMDLPILRTELAGVIACSYLMMG